ncbi:hypothetical protein [Amycolatopsis rifamycinica]|uniref:Uncharacterized protein n=1 Tax=Amycolatopsis rifamycinica TaxID=287986 RepID=A0A066U6A2_9PSEU|nr:hypothetical protein [Amycolatopsis rifamycinica]KDN23006.1 hypothetical protein DV20_04645 [Amycolatopsis rifamycinica]
MGQPEPDAQEATTTSRPGHGLAIASLAIGASGLTLAVATWAAWLIVRPELVSAWTLSWVTQAFVLVLGALWFALLPISVLALVFGICAGARTRPGYARIGATLAVVTVLLALSGAAVFATTSWRRVGPPIAYFDMRTSGTR